MSVPVWKRTESKVEFLSNFHKLRKEIIQILLRDFGIKEKTYTIELIKTIYNIDNVDEETLKNIMEKYKMNSIDLIKYPPWLIDTWRHDILKLLNLLGVEIELGNSIYVTTEPEYIERRRHFTLAIGYCNALKDKLQEIISMINVSVGAYTNAGLLLKKEIDLLKGVRKADTKSWNKLKNKQSSIQNL